MAEGIAFSFLGKLSEYLVAPIGRQFGYVFCYNRNIEEMERKVEDLEAKRRTVDLSVKAGENNCEVIGPDVKLWLGRVKDKVPEAKSILLDKEKIGKGCLNEWCIHLKSRYSVSRKATKRTKDLVVLIDAGNFPKVTYPGPPLGEVPKSSEDKKKTQLADEVQIDGPLVPDLAIASTSGSSSGGLESRLVIMRDIMETLRDENIHTIGICGMGGAGKTTMVHEIAERARKEECLFDDVVRTVLVSQEPDIKNIQLAIADFLDLKLTDHSSAVARAIRLHKRLTQNGSNGKPKRILLILDDLWKELDLKEVGIPFGDDHSGCKLVLTSRSNDVCVQMKADKIFLIPVLPEDEAWILFQNSLCTTNLYPIAKDIVKECGGLPIAITIIAKVLTEKEDTWNYVLRQLQRPSLEGECAEVYEKAFKVSYDNLKSQEIKDVFLLCCLFPEDFDIPIEDLARYGMGRMFFKKVYKLHEARQNVHAQVQVLKNLNLLLDSENEECVKMHDLVRDFGIAIASKGEFFVRFDKGLKEWPMEDICEQYTSISMQCDEMDEFPNELQYPNLKLLQMRGSNYHPLQMWGSNTRPFKFPERLDEVMGKLQVLALRCISITSLPESIERLSNLRTMSLCECGLNKDVSRIGNIEKLEILSFVGSNISELPREIGKLSRLRLLDLSECNFLRKIAPGVLSKLVRLEELYMRGTSIRWAEEIRATPNNEEEEEEVGDDKEAGDDEETYASFAELKQLSNLVAIDIHIEYKFLPIDLKFENLEKFRIFVGVVENWRIGMTVEIDIVSQNALLLEGDEIAPLKCLLKALCRKTEILYVEVKDLKNFSDEVERKDLRRLKILIFRSCDELVSVFDDGKNQSSHIHFSPLGLIPPFENLRALELSSCGKLKSIFSLSIARGLIKLETLAVYECSGIEEIFSKERGDDDQDEKKAVEFRHLKELHLYNLPNLVCFCKAAVDEVKFPQLNVMALGGLQKITSIYPEMKTSSSSSDGHHAYASSSSSANHSFFHQKVTLTNLKDLLVGEMENLTTVFPENVILQLHSLKSVHVEDCESVEVVFDLQGSNLNEGHHQVFSQFQSISLRRLPKLTSVWKLCPRVVPAFQTLKSLDVRECDSLRHLFTPSMAKTLVRLETLEISKCSGIEEIISKERGDDDQDEKKAVEFLNLKELRLEHLPNLVSFCKAVDQVLKFPQLKKMELDGLPKLTSFYPEMKTSSSSSDGHHAYASSSTNHPFFHQKVTLTNLKYLQIWQMENMTTVFPENVIPQLQSLESMCVETCKSVEVVFDLQGSNLNEGHHQVFSQFQSIVLKGLPKLTSVWKLCPRVVPAFQNLKLLDVIECDSLRHLFTPSMAKTLVRLDNLFVRGCKLLEAIVATEEGEEDEKEFTTEESILFPKLTGLHLKKLPSLLTILPEPCSFNWSTLKEITLEKEKRHLLRRPDHQVSV